MILLDTHTLIWLDTGSDKLGSRARSRIDTALGEESLAISAISFWELGMLQAKKRIELPPLAKWRRELLEMGLQELSVTGEHGILANELAGFHSDPADRLIVAAAIANDALLVTADRRILDWPGDVGRINAGK